MTKKKIKDVEILEVWEKNWSSPDMYAKRDQRRGWELDNRILLRCHAEGEYPFVKYEQ